MQFRGLFVLASAVAVNALKDEPETGLHLAALDWDQIEKGGEHDIQMETKDFTVENPHVEQQVLDETKREGIELEQDRAAFVKQMVELRDKAFAQLEQGHMHETNTQFVPKLRKIQLR